MRSRHQWIGASGARILVTLLHAIRRDGDKTVGATTTCIMRWLESNWERQLAINLITKTPDSEKLSAFLNIA